MPEAALDNWQPVWNAQVSISTPVCVNFELRPGAGDTHICWFNFDALAQGNAYKPTKEPINYRGPGGDRTHDLQTEATPPSECHSLKNAAARICSINAAARSWANFRQRIQSSNSKYYRHYGSPKAQWTIYWTQVTQQAQPAQPAQLVQPTQQTQPAHPELQFEVL